MFDWLFKNRKCKQHAATDGGDSAPYIITTTAAGGDSGTSHGKTHDTDPGTPADHGAHGASGQHDGGGGHHSCSSHSCGGHSCGGGH